MPDLTVHLFGPGDWPEEIGETAAVVRHADDRPDAALVQAACRNAVGPVAFVRADRVRPERLVGLAPATATVLLTDPAGATSGRGSADLVAALWRAAPGVAVFLGDDPLAAGAVIVAPSAAGRFASAAGTGGDALLADLAAIVAAGGTVTAVVSDEADTATSPPSTPPLLAPTSPPRNRRCLADLIRRADPGRRLAGGRNAADAAAVAAGLLLWHDFLDESHAVSQSIEGEGTHNAGDYWHAIMHRRERDYGNAKYWFRRVGRHPVFGALADRAVAAVAGEPTADDVLARVVPGGRWDAAAFVDSCAEAERTADADLDRVLRVLQADEMLLLLGQTVRDAAGG